MRKPMLAFFFSLLSTCIHAGTYYVAPGGVDSNPGSISAPWATWSKAYSTATASDTVYFRAGNYTISSTIDGNTVGHDGSSGSPVTFSNYPGEKVVTTCSTSIMFDWDKQYHWVIADQLGNMEFDGVSWIFAVGSNGNGMYSVFKNLKLTISTYDDNSDCVHLQADRSSYAIIQNNIMIGPASRPSTNCAGVTYIGVGQSSGVLTTGTNYGSKILNNDISSFSHGIYNKHCNSDTASTGGEQAYNYIHNCDDSWYGQPQYINHHDNIDVNVIDLGDNGGGGSGSYTTINHNTCPGGIGFENQSPGPQTNFTITNNIFSSYSSASNCSGCTYNYNMYGSGAKIGENDLANTSPTYTGGSSPSTIAGFTLTPGSAGHAAGSDGLDMGANTTMVGMGSSVGGGGGGMGSSVSRGGGSCFISTSVTDRTNPLILFFTLLGIGLISLAHFSRMFIGK